MLERPRIQITFCREYGDESLLPLKDLVSSVPDEKKELILDYLRTNYTLACPGIVYDILDPKNVIGDGSIYMDGTYAWPDYLPAYIEKYNIRIPDFFRNHILENYESRKQVHKLLKLVDKIIIRNNPYLGYHCEVCISRNGLIEYQNNTDSIDKVILMIAPSDAAWIINPIMVDLFCYDDEDGHGQAMIDGYHWEIDFFIKGTLQKHVEGWPGENSWRHTEIERIVHFAERYIPKDLGGKYMYEDEG